MDYKQWALKGKAGLKSATTILSINLNLLRNDAIHLTKDCPSLQPGENTPSKPSHPHVCGMTE
jgi:hypothetical protein